MTMKFKLLTILSITCVMTLTSIAEAGTVKLHRNRSAYSSYTAGEFLMYDLQGLDVAPMGMGVQVSDGPFDGDFQAFCVERTESIRMDRTYQFEISTETMGYGDPDPLSAESAYLYTQFWNGTLTNYDFTLGYDRVASATALQDAFWYLEGEINSTSNLLAMDWVNQALSAVGNGDWVGLGNVRIMNLYRYNHFGRLKHAQDQLVMIDSPPPPPPPNVVPLPGAAPAGLGLMVALGGIRQWRRRGCERIV